MTDFEVIISGAGPAGSSLAIWLSRRGIRVLLTDKFHFPRDKVCGEAISPGAVDLLEDLGVKNELEKISTEKFYGVSFVSPSKKERLVNYPENKFGYAVSRKTLDKIILDQAQQNPLVTVIEGFMLKNLKVEKDKVFISGNKDKKDLQFSAKLLVAADGRYSTIAGLINNYRSTEEFRRYVYVATLNNVQDLTNHTELIIRNKKYQYLVSRQGKEQASIAVVINDPKFAKGTMNKESFLGLLKESDSISKRIEKVDFETKLKGIILQKYRLKTLVHDRVLYVGDSTGFIDPITGEGIYRALKSSHLASEVIFAAVKKKSYQKKDLEEYQNKLLREFNPIYRFIKTAVFLTTNETVAEFVIKRMNREDSFAKKLVSLQGALIPGKELLTFDTAKLCLKMFR